MDETNLAAFAIGIFSATIVGGVIRILLGMRLKLYLINTDTLIEDQAVIPLTAENKKSSALKALFHRNWYEDVDLTLRDYKDRVYSYQIGYHIWNRFFLVLADNTNASSLNGKPIESGRRYWLRTGMKLSLGDRHFAILVTPTQVKPDLSQELFNRSSSQS